VEAAASSSGPQIAGARNRKTEHASTCYPNEDIPLRLEVGRQEDNRREFRQLARLEGERPCAQPHARAIDRGAKTRKYRQRQQEQGRQPGGVGVSGQLTVLAHADECCD
jgi:hypothetical protein